jgi:hypothetical protein
MEDLIEQANEIQESMSRTYGVPDELDEADLEAGRSAVIVARNADRRTELDALGDDLGLEEETAIPSYLQSGPTRELPDFVDEPPMTSVCWPALCPPQFHTSLERTGSAGQSRIELQGRLSPVPLARTASSNPVLQMLPLPRKTKCRLKGGLKAGRAKPA